MSVFRMLNNSIFFNAFAIMFLSACGQQHFQPAEHVSRAKDFIDKGELRSANIELSNALEQDPKLMEARWLLANVSVDLGNPAKAEKEARKAVELGLARAAAQALLVKAIFLQGEFDRLISESTPSALELQKNDQSIVLAYRGLAYLGKGNFKEAESILNQALQIDPPAAIAWTGLATLRRAQNDVVGVREAVRKALDLDARSPEAWSLLADIELNDNNLEKADEAYSKAIEHRKYLSLDKVKRALVRVRSKKLDDAAKDIASMREQGFKDDPLLNFVQGLIDFSQGKYPEALVSFQASNEKDPNSIRTEIYLAVTHFRLNHIEQALDIAQRTLVKAPKLTAANRLLGAIEISRSDYVEAKKVLLESLTRAPNDEGMLYMMATVSLKEGDSAEGIKYLERILALEPESAQARDMLVAAKLMGGQSIKKLVADRFGATPSREDSFTQELLLAVEAFDRKRIAEALEKAQALNLRDPKRIEPLNLIAACYLSTAQWVKAKATLEKVLAIDARDANATLNLAKVEFNQGNFERVKQLLTANGTTINKTSDAILLLSQTEERLGRFEDSIKTLEIGVQKNPALLPVRERLAFAYNRSGNHVKVLELARGVTDQQFRSAPRLLEALGKAYAITGDKRNSLETYKKLAAIEPQRAASHFLYSDVLARSGQFEAARKELSKAVDIDSHYLPARIGAIKMLVQKGDNKQAKSDLTKLEKDFGANPDVLGIKGWFALGAGDYPSAENSLRLAVEKKPSSELVVLLSRALWSQTKHDGAIEVLQNWLKKSENDVLVLEQLGEVYVGLSRMREASSVYNRIVTTNPKNVMALNNLAWIEQDESLESAVKHAEQALSLSPGHPIVSDTLGALLTKSGQLARAESLIKVAVSAMPENQEFQFHMGQLLLAQKRVEEAKKVLKSVVSKAPQSKAGKDAKLLLESKM